jgi:hypothetical protein
MIKTIYILWLQGFDNAPEIVKNCVNSWKYYNSDWNIILLDSKNLINYIHLENYITPNNSIEKCHLSDIIRMILLNLYGGLWVDATTFCNASLNDWLPNCINERFFAFDKPGTDRLISNWFLYSDKNNYIIDKWCCKTLDYYSINDRAHTYFIHHYLFGDLYNSDIKFKEIWDKVPKKSANGIGPHYLQEKGMFNNINNETKKDIDTKLTPLYKLTYKCNFPKYNKNINLYYLFSTIKY